MSNPTNVLDWVKPSALQALLTASQYADKPSYSVSVTVAATASTDLIAIEAGTTKTTRLVRLTLMNPGLQTTAGLRAIQVIRTTTAGTAGVVTPAPLDTNDPAFTGIARSAPTGQGTAGTKLFDIPVFVPAAAAVYNPTVLLDFTKSLHKAPVIQPGVTNGIAIRDPGAAGGASLTIVAEFVEE